ncbi:MAG: hypothetical protein WD096_10525 [Actinomycetota bacterium]
MPDLRDRFQLVDRLATPDLWSKAVARARTVHPGAGPEPGGPRARSRLVAATVALVVFVAAAVVAWDAFFDRSASTTVDQPTPSAVEPLVISVREDPGPPFDVVTTASFAGVTIDLDGIETPGDELGYPTTDIGVPIPLGAPIEIRGDADSVRVRELVPDGPGDLFDVRAERLPGDLAVLGGIPRATALSVYAEGSSWVAEYGFTLQLVDADGQTDQSVLASGNAHGSPWTLVTVGGDTPTGLELRWDEPVPGTESVHAASEIVVGWHHFGRFEPDDDVIFGIVPAEATSVHHVPGWGLPETEIQVIDVAGADWHAFVFSSYLAIGTLTASGANGAYWEHLIIPPGCEPMLRFVESFLEARMDGQGADAFLTPEALSEFGRMGVAPLYAGEDGGAYTNWQVLFLDGAGLPSGCDVGVRLKAADGTVAEDTLAVGERNGSLVVYGLQPGTTGP